MAKTAQTMRAWQYTTILNNSLPQSLKLTSTPLPTPSKTQHLIKINYVSLNPVDVKPAESPVARRLLVPNPSTPGIDFAGTIVKPAEGTPFKVGDRVFGCGPSPFSGGCLAEYAVAGIESTVHVPKGVTLEQASTIGVAGLTAWQSIIPHKPQRVFLNGGSGGTGIFGIQIAKAHGMQVAVTCSTRNLELCKSLGADEVVDYTKGGIASTLAKHAKYDLIVDNVMNDLNLYWAAHRFTNPGSKYIVVAAAPSLKYVGQSMQMKLPGWMGGGQRNAQGMMAKPNVDELGKIAELMVQGKIKTVVDQKFEFEDVRAAFEKLKTGRARGKIVVEVCRSED